MEFQRKILTSLDRLLNKINSSSVLKDGKIEAVRSLLEQQETLYLLEIEYAARRGRKSRVRHQ